MTVSGIRQQPRSIVVRAAALALMALAVLLVVRSGDNALATSGGSPYEVTQVTDANGNPDIVETTIIADEASVDIGGVTANVQAFNGTLPGPEFRLKVGDRVIVHFENHLNAGGTGIHWHGIELANSEDGTPLTQNLVPPGGTFEYEFTVTRPGIYWYHPHHHSSTNQVFKGLYGSIIVTDPNDTDLRGNVLPSTAQTRTLSLSDITVCKSSYAAAEPPFDLSLPWQDGTQGPLPEQFGHTPVDLCQTAPVDEEGMPRAPFAAGDVPNTQQATAGVPLLEGVTVLTNGTNVGGRAGSPSAPGALAAGASTLDVRPGQGLRLQLGNAATTRFFRLRMTDDTGNQIPLVRIGGQGGLLENAVIEGGLPDGPGGFDFKYDAGEIMIGPGAREDVVVAIPNGLAEGTKLTLWTKDFKRTGAGALFSNIPTVPVMHLNVTGSAVSPAYAITAGTPILASSGDTVETLPAADAILLDPATFMPPELGTPNQDIRLTNQHAGGKLGINGTPGEHDFEGIDFTEIEHMASTRWATIGDTLELTVTNTTGAHHPFHLHGFSHQPIDLTDGDPAAAPVLPPYTFPEQEFKDNTDVPAGYKLRFRIRLDDRPLVDGTPEGGGLGRWVFHCHIFFHATFGMISEVVVVPSDNEPPEINANAASVTVNEGQTATMTGTYSDPDGDAVTLSASLGTITDTGGGTWSWTYPTTDGPDENQTITVTATDPDSESDSATFALNVVNVNPAVSISSPTNLQLFQLADSVPVTAPFTDPGTGDTHTCSIAWGDGITTAGAVAQGAGFGTCTGSHTYALGGLKTITVTVTDDDGGSHSASVTIDINTPPDCTPVQPNLKSLWPPNHAFRTVTIFGATDADGDIVTLTVNTVTQDEVLNGNGDGDTSPDAALVAGHPDQVKLRSERSGNGDGRVYRLGFGGDDGRGGTCTGLVKVIVVHDQHDDTAIDSGLNVNSFGP